MVGNDTPLWIVPANQQETHFRHFIDRGANLGFRGKLTTFFDRSQGHGDLDGEDNDGADDDEEHDDEHDDENWFWEAPL